LPPQNPQSPAGADPGAVPAAVADLPVQDQGRIQAAGVPWADLRAIAAADAVPGVKGDFRPGVDGIRVVAPGAVQITALEEDRGADAGAVFQRVPFNIQNKGLRLSH